jgi:hypothetical protein
MIFSKIKVQFRIRIRIHNLELQIRILQKVSDPYGSGSTTLVVARPHIKLHPGLDTNSATVQA